MYGLKGVRKFFTVLSNKTAIYTVFLAAMQAITQAITVLSTDLRVYQSHESFPAFHYASYTFTYSNTYHMLEREIKKTQRERKRRLCIYAQCTCVSTRNSRVNAYIHIRVHTYTYIFIYIYICIYTYACAHTHYREVFL